MKLQHFTATHHVYGSTEGLGHAGPGILRVGLIPNPHPSIALPPHVWLTQDETFVQAWSPRPVDIKGERCDRTEVRLTIAIPSTHRQQLLTWPTVRRFVLDEDVVVALEKFGQPADWRVFVGRIPRAWIRAVVHREPLLDIGRPLGMAIR